MSFDKIIRPAQKYPMYDNTKPLDDAIRSSPQPLITVYIEVLAPLDACTVHKHLNEGIACKERFTLSHMSFLRTNPTWVYGNVPKLCMLAHGLGCTAYHMPGVQIFGNCNSGKKDNLDLWDAV